MFYTILSRLLIASFHFRFFIYIFLRLLSIFHIFMIFITLYRRYSNFFCAIMNNLYSFFLFCFLSITDMLYLYQIAQTFCNLNK